MSQADTLYLIRTYVPRLQDQDEKRSLTVWLLVAASAQKIICSMPLARELGYVPYITSTSRPFFDRSGSVHEARSKQQGRRLPDRSFEIPTSTRRSRV